MKDKRCGLAVYEHAAGVPLLHRGYAGVGCRAEARGFRYFVYVNIYKK